MFIYRFLQLASDCVHVENVFVVIHTKILKLDILYSTFVFFR